MEEAPQDRSFRIKPAAKKDDSSRNGPLSEPPKKSKTLRNVLLVLLALVVLLLIPGSLKDLGLWKKAERLTSSDPDFAGFEKYVKSLQSRRAITKVDTGDYSVWTNPKWWDNLVFQRKEDFASNACIYIYMARGDGKYKTCTIKDAFTGKELGSWDNKNGLKVR